MAKKSKAEKKAEKAAEQARLEAERLEAERIEAERLEKERIERERQERIRKELERVRKEKEADSLTAQEAALGTSAPAKPTLARTRNSTGARRRRNLGETKPRSMQRWNAGVALVLTPPFWLRLSVEGSRGPAAGATWIFRGQKRT